MAQKRQQLVGQIMTPGGKPQSVNLTVNSRPVITSAEAAAGVQWVDDNYAPGNVLRYGTNTTPGTTDMTTTIQAALDQATQTGGARVVVPSGTYLINSDANTLNGDKYGCLVSGNTEVYLESGAILQGETNSSTHYAVLMVSGDNVLIHGKGTIRGDKDTHTGGTGEWGNCLDIRNSDYVNVKDVTCTNGWGDGIYVGGHVTTGAICNDIHLLNVRCHGNRRNNLSVVGVDTMSITDSTFDAANGTAPQAGIDIEPNAALSCKNISVAGCSATGNTGNGFLTVGDASSVFRVKFANCDSISNSLNGFEIQNSSFGTVVSCSSAGNTGDGIYLDRSDDCVVSSNIVGTNANGIRVTTGNRNLITSNSVRLNNSHGIFLENVSPDNIINDNICYANGQTTDNTYDNINIDTNSDRNSVKGNTCIQGTGETNQSRYGINIVVSTCEANEVMNNDVTDGGQTGGFNDAGTGTKKHNGLSILNGSTTWNPGSIAVGEFESKNIAITDAALGDLCIASFSLDTTDLVLSAVVVSTNTVTCTLINNTLGAVDLASGTLRAWVFKQ